MSIFGTGSRLWDGAVAQAKAAAQAVASGYQSATRALQDFGASLRGAPGGGGAGQPAPTPAPAAAPAPAPPAASGPAAAVKNNPATFSPQPPGQPCATCQSPPPPAPASTAVTEAEFQAFKDYVISEEGYETVVYLDTNGHPTVGVGHLVLPGDNLKVGDEISVARVEELFRKDAMKALEAAKKQAAEAGITDPAFLPYLASVNFQLGTGWRTKIAPDQTWPLIVEGKYEEAAQSFEGTKWQKQTPKRVEAFQGALRRLPPKA